ncbi:MAG: hypothetical protein K2P58_13970 [Hyphomonadaceae bacterium]|nr:hypothetical protein [Hyphomonadaceae bacterium]
MKKTIAAFLCVGAILAPAAVFAGTVENGFGNTFVVTTAQGELRYHFNADGTVSVTNPAGETQSGTWTMQSDQLCITAAGGQPSCVEVAADKSVGDTWQQQGADGSSITVTLLAGR